MNDYLGISVSMTGDGSRVIAGARGANPGGFSYAGKAYIFVRSGSTWIEESKIFINTLEEHCKLGSYVAIDGNGTRAFAGAIGWPDNNNQYGRVYVYSRSGTNWTKAYSLQSSTPEAYGQYGWCVAISGDSLRLIVSAMTIDLGVLDNVGGAYLYY